MTGKLKVARHQAFILNWGGAKKNKGLLLKAKGNIFSLLPNKQPTKNNLWLFSI